MEKRQEKAKKEVPIKEDEFMIVRHSYLNSGSYNEGIYDQLEEIAKYTNGRKPVNALEGDIIQVRETGEPILTHQSWLPVSQARYNLLRREKIACSLEEALAKARAYQEKHPESRLVLCLEPKLITDKATLEKAMEKLQEYGFQDSTYFDSFFANKLDQVEELNQQNNTQYPRSLHLVGNIGKIALPFPIPSKTGKDIITVPKATSLGNPQQPVIYGAVGSLDTLEQISRNPEVKGAYLRVKEGGGLKGMVKMLWNSATNRYNLRGNHNK